MIVNARYRFIFVHVPKTAGVSVAAALAGLPGRRAGWVSRTTKHETTRSSLQDGQRTGRAVGEVERFQVLAFVRTCGTGFFPCTATCSSITDEIPPRASGCEVDFPARLLPALPDWSATIRSLRPQVDFLPPGNVRLMLGRFETLTEDFERILVAISAWSSPYPTSTRPPLPAATIAGPRRRKAWTSWRRILAAISKGWATDNNGLAGEGFVHIEEPAVRSRHRHDSRRSQDKVGPDARGSGPMSSHEGSLPLWAMAGPRRVGSGRAEARGIAFKNGASLSG